MKITYCKSKNQKGFTLIEVLISVTILSIGLLGIAGLQVKGLRYTQSAFYSSQATSLAYAIADSIHANPALGDTTYLLDSPAPYYELALSYTVPTTYPSCIGTTATCAATSTTNPMATFDKNEWLKDVASSLPLGDGSITFTPIWLNTPPNIDETAIGIEYTIKIVWDDNRDGDNTDAEEQYTYTLNTAVRKSL